MRPKTEELLYYLLWTCEMLTRPTFRNLTSSFEVGPIRMGCTDIWRNCNASNSFKKGLPVRRVRLAVDAWFA
jgi:hypothetical protein